ncbi:MAG: PorV/PorQ family protein [Elusimicrobia bacterium]|nr:PorV/PorQ family protein [Elusimicrobiota bacterium]
MKKRIFFFAVLAVLSVLSALVASAVFASEGAAFLKIGIGARPIGLGNAFTAIANDVNAIAWNPAGLTQITQRELGVMHAELFADTKYDFAGVVQPLNAGALGFGLAYLSQGSLEVRDANRQSQGSFNASDMATTFSYARILFPKFYGGASLKIIRSQIAQYSATTFALDIGSLYNTPIERLKAGIALQNLGPGMKFIDTASALPLTMATGFGYQLPQGPILALDFKYRPYSRKTNVSLGMEYPVLGILSLRAGYLGALSSAVKQGTNKLGDFTGLGAGFGIRVLSSHLDYAFTPMGELGASHRMSLAVKF